MKLKFNQSEFNHELEVQSVYEDIELTLMTSSPASSRKLHIGTYTKSHFHFLSIGTKKFNNWSTKADNGGGTEIRPFHNFRILEMVL
jgi:hypothetical protein